MSLAEGALLGALVARRIRIGRRSRPVHEGVARQSSAAGTAGLLSVALRTGPAVPTAVPRPRADVRPRPGATGRPVVLQVLKVISYKQTPVHTHRWPAANDVLNWSDFVRHGDDGTVLDSHTAPALWDRPSAPWSAPLPPL